MSEHELDLTLRQVAFDFVKREPVRVILLTIPKLWYLYYEDVSGIYHNVASSNDTTLDWTWKIFRLLTQSYYMVMLAASFFSLKYFRILKRYPHTLLAGLVILYMTGIYLIFFGMGRFHIPILPLIFLFSGYSLLAIFDGWIRPKWHKKWQSS